MTCCLWCLQIKMNQAAAMAEPCSCVAPLQSYWDPAQQEWVGGGTCCCSLQGKRDVLVSRMQQELEDMQNELSQLQDSMPGAYCSSNGAACV